MVEAFLPEKSFKNIFPIYNKMETPKLIVRSCWCRNHKNVWKKRFLSAFEREKSCDQIKSVASNFSGFQGVGINIPSCSFQPFSLAVCKKRVQIEERPPWLEMSVCPHPNLGAWFGNQIWNPPFLLKRDVKRCSKNTDFFGFIGAPITHIFWEYSFWNRFSNSTYQRCPKCSEMGT